MGINANALTQFARDLEITVMEDLLKHPSIDFAIGGLAVCGSSQSTIAYILCGSYIAASLYYAKNKDNSLAYDLLVCLGTVVR